MTGRKEVWPTIEDLQRPDVLRLHLGELGADELRVAQAAVRYCYSQLSLMREDSRRRGASAGVLSHVVGAPGVTDDESRDDAIAKENLASLRSSMPNAGQDSDFERDG